MVLHILDMTIEGSRIARRAIRKMKKLHDPIKNELNEFGKELGFDVDKKKLFFSIPDVVWSINLKELYDENGKKLFNLNKDFIVPIAIFEVIYSETEKKIYGSFSKLHLNRALFKAVVTLPKRYEKHDEWSGWKKWPKDVIDKLSPQFPDINIISDTDMGINFISYKRFLNKKSVFKSWLKWFIG